jgi:hypothetical protein
MLRLHPEEHALRRIHGPPPEHESSLSDCSGESFDDRAVDAAPPPFRPGGSADRDGVLSSAPFPAVEQEPSSPRDWYSLPPVPGDDDETQSGRRSAPHWNAPRRGFGPASHGRDGDAVEETEDVRLNRPRLPPAQLPLLDGLLSFDDGSSEALDGRARSPRARWATRLAQVQARDARGRLASPTASPRAASRPPRPKRRMPRVLTVEERKLEARAMAAARGGEDDAAARGVLARAMAFARTGRS